MTTYAFVNDQGSVTSVNTAPPNTYSHGTYAAPNQIAIEVADDVNVPELFSIKYWDNEWKTRDASPGDYYKWKNGAWVFDSTQFFLEVRTHRNNLLDMTDKYMLADFPIVDEARELYATYRASLRTVPDDNASVTKWSEITWPEEPGA
jgi:hypothetical protein